MSEVLRFRDFLAFPGCGSHGRARWQQTMGSIVLRLLLSGAPWEGVTDDEFQVRLCERGLRVANSQRPEASEAILEDSLSGDFPPDQEVLVRSSWWSLEPSNEDPRSREFILAIHLVKAKDRSWQHPFKDGKLAAASDLSADWVVLRPGERRDYTEDADLGIRPSDLLREVVFSQTEDLAIVRLLLDPDKLEVAKRLVPMSRLWALDLTEDRIQVFLRGQGTPMLSGQLGGRIMPGQTDWSMTKVSREGGDVRQTCPALTVQLRKAACSRLEWPEVMFHDPQCVAEKDTLGSLDEELEGNKEGQLRSISDAPEAKTPAEFASDLKRRGDDFFRKQNWDAAVDFYTQGLNHTPGDEKLLSNRSAAFAEAKRFQPALDDAMQCIEIAPEWPKAFFRQGVALRGLRRYDMSISVFSEGKARDPTNPSWQREIAETESLKAARQAARSQR